MGGVPRHTQGGVCIALIVAAFSASAEVSLEDAARAAQRDDYETALRVWRPLAEGGEPIAQFELGRLHAQGRGTELDYDEAVRWYRRAAEQGYPPAQYQLGLHYYGGLGAPQNRLEAFFWIGLARLAGLEAASRWIDEVDTRLTEDEEVELRQRLSTWQPTSASEPPSVASPQPPAESEPEGPPAAATAADVEPGRGGYRIQLGSLRTAEAAHDEWTRLYARHGDLLADLTLSVVRADLGPARGVFFRVRAGPLAGRADAAALCRDLGERGVACLVIAPAE